MHSPTTLCTALLAIAVTVSALQDNSLPARNHNVLRRTACASLPKTTTTIAGAAATLSGPFQLAASAPGEPYDGKFAESHPPDGSCCSNFFIYGIPPSLASVNAATFYLNGDQLVSVQDGAMWTAYDGGVSDPISSHVLLGDGGDLTSNPVLSCSVNDSCELECTASGGLVYNCLASPGFQPDWRLAVSKDGAGPGCTTFTPVVHPGAGANDGGSTSIIPVSPSSSAAPSSGASSSSSAPASSSSSSSSSSGSKKKNTSTMVKTISGPNGAPAQSSSTAPTANANMALQTAAPAILANAAIAIGVLAAL